MKKTIKRHNSAPLFLLGGAGIAALAALITFRGGTLPIPQFSVGGGMTGGTADPNTWTPIAGVPSSSGGIDTGTYAGIRYGLGFIPYTSTGGGAVTVQPGGSTLTPTLSTDTSPTRGGSSTGTNFSVGGYYK